MAQLSKNYMVFYLYGREEKLFKDRDIDEDELADKLMDGTPVREICDKVAESLAAKYEHDRTRKLWIDERRSEIDEAGGDADEAFRHYMQGRKDQYAHSLEDDVIEAAFSEGDEDDDEDDDGDDDDDEDEQTKK